ncbi:hypothetical protein VMCG_04415 [Cytospora schulzeri]|uniref:Uncharacterized protein n=1 Tax=Cytospora schulzeri TaxID=448051 RepID=A0A423WTC6_9PEZI|nr:hypothetical protein VMCG_04415 [Valsa malicola]
MAVSPSLPRVFGNNTTDRPPPCFSITVAQAEPSLALLPPSLFLFTLSPDELRPNIELFAHKPVVFHFAHSPSFGSVSRVVLEVWNIFEHVILVVV